MSTNWANDGANRLFNFLRITLTIRKNGVYKELSRIPIGIFIEIDNKVNSVNNVNSVINNNNGNILQENNQNIKEGSKWEVC